MLAVAAAVAVADPSSASTVRKRIEIQAAIPGFRCMAPS
jgi:hypothetical protein